MNVRPAASTDDDAVRALAADAALAVHRPSCARGEDGIDLVAEEEGRLLAEGSFARLYGPTAELGFVASGAEPAAVLVEALCAHAREAGIRRLIAELRAGDEAALTALRHAARTREVVDGDRIDVALLLDR